MQNQLSKTNDQRSTKSADGSVDPAILDVLEWLATVCIDAPEADGILVYCSELSDVDPDLLRVGARRYVNEAEKLYYPSIGTLRRFASESEHGVIPDWEIIWDQLVAASKIWYPGDDQSAQRVREMLGPAILRVASVIGGLRAIQDANDRTLPVLRGQFRAAWTNRKESEERKRRLPSDLQPQARITAGQPRTIEDLRIRP